MQVICTDGTVLQCKRFEAIDSGVLLFGEERRSEADEEDEEEDEEFEAEAMAFVPLHQLRFVLPEGIQPGAPASQPVSQPPQQAGPTQAPPMGGMPQQTPPQGATGQQMPPGQSGTHPPSQSGPGQR